MNDKIKITASNLEEFKKVQRIYDELPNRVKNNIESASTSNMFTSFVFSECFEDKISIIVPKDIFSVEGSSRGVKIFCKNAVFEYPYLIDRPFNISVQ